MNHRLLLSVIAGIGLMTSSIAMAQLTDANEIVERANNASYYAGEDGRSAARMLIVDGDNQQQRQFMLLRKDVEDGGDQRYLVVFSRPADIRGTVFRVEKKVGQADDRWLYLPALDLVRRISSGDKRTSFVGSNFFYEDISGRDPAEDTHELVETNADYYVIESTPRDPDSVEFAAFQTWIDRETMLPMRSEYRRENGEIYRRMEVTEVEVIDGYPTGTEMRMSDLDSGSYTITQFAFSEYDIGLPDDIFSERSLRNPPRQWLRRD